MSTIRREGRGQCESDEQKLEQLYFYGFVSPKEYKVISTALQCDTCVVSFNQVDGANALFNTWTIEICRKIEKDLPA